MIQKHCANMNTRAKVTSILGDTAYKEAEGLPNGVLPTKKQVVECMMYLLRPNRAGTVNRSREDAAKILSYVLVEHWEHCNIYTIHERHVANKILVMYKQFSNLKKNRARYTNASGIEKLSSYNSDMNTLFDIYCEDKDARKSKEEAADVTMGKMEFDFLEDMRTQRIGFCSDQVDRCWQRSMKRKEKRELSLQNKQKKMAEDQNVTLTGAAYKASFDACQIPEEDHADDVVHDGDDAVIFDDDAIVHDCDNDVPVKKRRILTNAIPIEQSMSDKLPAEYRHIRRSVKNVRQEFYITIDKLMSVYHCSYSQALAGVIETGNILFDRHWKFNDDSSCIDLDTVPTNKQLRTASKAILSLSLAEIVEEMMGSDDAVLTYQEDGSKKKGCGSFSVQGCTINGKYRAFPTLPIASESRENLATLKRTILDVLSCVSGGKYTSKQIFEKIQFKITDGPSHNYGVDDLVALDLGTDHIPEHLLCHTHPVLMFNRKLVETFAAVEEKIGSDKIFSKLLVQTTNTHDSVTEQFIHCVVNLFSPELNHKSWNRSDDFSTHIAPSKNFAVGFRTERFNRFVYLCAILIYHDAHIWSFLTKYEDVTNNLACIVRAFEDVEFLKIHCAVAALFGIHLIEPYLSLTTSTNTTYSKLIPAMQQLYTDLITVNPDRLLDVSKPALAFISVQRFELTKQRWEKCVLDAIVEFTAIHKERMIKLISVILPKLAEGFHLQRANVFGFGDFDENSEMLVTTKDMSKLDQVPIHNLSAERHVGSVNYGLGVHGATQLGIVSSSIVKSKSYDLIELKPVEEFDKYRYLTKKDGKLLTILSEWNEKQEQLKKEGLCRKEIANIGVDKRKNSDLEKLKEYGGPFTNPEDVLIFANSDTPEETKEKRLYLEVRYARDTSLSLPKSSPMFRLKQNYRNLPLSTYVQNLTTYLSKVSCTVNVTWSDFDNAVDILHEDCLIVPSQTDRQT